MTQNDEAAALARWGFKWLGATEGTHAPMLDGYWTPWHLANEAIEALTTERDRLLASQERAIAEAVAKREAEIVAWLLGWASNHTNQEDWKDTTACELAGRIKRGEHKGNEHG